MPNSKVVWSKGDPKPKSPNPITFALWSWKTWGRKFYREWRGIKYGKLKDGDF